MIKALNQRVHQKFGKLLVRVGKIFSRWGPPEDFSKIFPGGSKVVIFVFSHSKPKKIPFFAEDFKIQVGAKSPHAPLQTPMPIGVGTGKCLGCERFLPKFSQNGPEYFVQFSPIQIFSHKDHEDLFLL